MSAPTRRRRTEEQPACVIEWFAVASRPVEATHARGDLASALAVSAVLPIHLGHYRYNAGTPRSSANSEMIMAHAITAAAMCNL
jgi:hypothetical protein